MPARHRIALLLPLSLVLLTTMPCARLLAQNAPSASSQSAPCCGPVTPQAQRLSQFLDHSGVDHLWQPGYRVKWDTGESLSQWDDDRPHTHCSAFVASAAMQLGVYILRPPEHSAVLLASAQMVWLKSPQAAQQGWHGFADVMSAQQAANRGELVVAAYENPQPDSPGHIAIIRPSTISSADLLQTGPLVTQAGGHNALSEPLARGFANHKTAWQAGGSGEVRFFGHMIDASKL